MIIGLTGLTGAGKSSAAEILRGRGCHIIDADKVGHSVTAKPEVLDKIKNAFGAEVIAPDGTLNRRVLGKIVFAAGGKLRLLNSITHPAITDEIKAEAAAHSGETVVIDCALLKECGLDKLCGKILCITADEAVRLERIMKRDGLSRGDALNRINSQAPYSGPCRVIDNSGSIAELEAAIEEALCSES